MTVEGRPRREALISGAVLAFLGLAAGAVLLHATPWGLGLGGDSYYYVSGARNIAAGEGFVRIAEDGGIRPITHFPPLYSAALAVLMGFGIDPINGARWLHAVLFGANVILTGRIIARGGGRPMLGILGAVVFLTSPAMLSVHAWLLSEGMFLFLMLTFFERFQAYLDRGRMMGLVASALLASLAALTRYLGVALVIAGLLAILVWRRPTSKRSRAEAPIFGAVSLLLPILWAIRNITLAGTPSNRSLMVHLPKASQLLAGADTISLWFLPADIPVLWRLVVMAALAGLVGAAMVRNHRKGSTPPAMATMGAVVLLFVAVYAAAVLGSLTFLDAAVPLDDRMLAPVFASALAVLLWGLAPGLAAREHVSWLRLLVGGGLAVVLILNGWREFQRVSLLRMWGAGYASPDWRHSGVIAWVADLPPYAPLYSNELSAIYLLTGHPAQLAPVRWDPVRGVERDQYRSELRTMRARLREQGGALAWFTGLAGQPPDTRTEAELAQGLVEAYRGFDGVVYVPSQ